VKVKQELNKAQAELKEIQQWDRKEREAGLQHWIEEAEQKAKDSNDSNAGQKTAKQIKAIIWAERQQESYNRIKQVFKYTAWGAGLQ
jgi:hypothetical protein